MERILKRTFTTMRMFYRILEIRECAHKSLLSPLLIKVGPDAHINSVFSFMIGRLLLHTGNCSLLRKEAGRPAISSCAVT
jgi:hypothetical protein